MTVRRSVNIAADDMLVSVYNGTLVSTPEYHVRLYGDFLEGAPDFCKAPFV